MTQTNPPSTANLVTTAAQAATNTFDAAHAGTAAVIVGLLNHAEDALGVIGFGADLGETTLQELKDKLVRFIQTGERPVHP